MKTISNENQLLIFCARIDIDSITLTKITKLLNSKLDWDVVLNNAKEQSIAPLLYYHLSKLKLLNKVPHDIFAELKRISKGVLGRNISNYDELKIILKLFERAGIDVILLKGASYIETIYKNIALRPMADIDLLVKEVNLKKTRQLLLQNGYKQKKLWYEHPKVDFHHLVPFKNPNNNMLVEVHWSIGMYDQLFNIDMEEVWQRTKIVNIENQKMIILSPEDMVLHQCCHIFLQHCGEISLKNLCDLSETIRHYTINWGIVLDSGLRFKLGTFVYSGLYLIKEILDTNLPSHVLSNLISNCSKKQLIRLNKIVKTDFIYQESIKAKHPLTRIYWLNGSFNKIKYLAITLFPPKAILAKRYSLNRISIFTYLYYFVRPAQLLVKHGRATLKLIFNAPINAFNHLFKLKTNKIANGVIN